MNDASLLLNLMSNPNPYPLYHNYEYRRDDRRWGIYLTIIIYTTVFVKKLETLKVVIGERSLLLTSIILSVVKNHDFLRHDSHRRCSRQTREAATQYQSNAFGIWRGFYTDAALNYAVIYFLG